MQRYGRERGAWKRLGKDIQCGKIKKTKRWWEKKKKNYEHVPLKTINGKITSDQNLAFMWKFDFWKTFICLCETDRFFYT